MQHPEIEDLEQRFASILSDLVWCCPFDPDDATPVADAILRLDANELPPTLLTAVVVLQELYSLHPNLHHPADDAERILAILDDVLDRPRSISPEELLARLDEAGVTLLAGPNP